MGKGFIFGLVSVGKGVVRVLGNCYIGNRVISRAVDG